MSNLKAGICRLEITPPLGLHIPGYFSPRIADAVNDPLTATAIAVSDGDNTAVIFSIDLIGIRRAVAEPWAATVAERNGLSKDAIFFSCTHTHTGPAIKGHNYDNDEVYDDYLLRRLCDAATFAIKDMAPVKGMYAGEKESKGITFLRRFRMKDGHVQTHGKAGDPNLVETAGVADESLRLLRIVRENAAEILLVNFQLHSDTVGGTAYSADYAGIVRTTVERVIPNSRCAYFYGASGNLNHNNAFPKFPLPPKGYYGITQKIGRTITGTVLQIYDEAQPLADGAVTFHGLEVTADTKKDDSRIPEAERIIQIHKEGRQSELTPPWKATPMIAEAYIIKRLENGPYQQDLHVSAITFGDVAFVGFPGEIFCEFGQEIRAASPFPCTFTCSPVNGGEGYYPTQKAFEEGGYEPSNTPYKSGTGEKLIQAAIGMLKKAKK